MINLTKAKIFSILVIGLGIISLIVLFSRANFYKLNYIFILLCIIAVNLRYKDSSNLPELKSHQVVTNSFVFLAFLLYGGAPAVIIAGAEALVSSWRFAKDNSIIAFNTAVAVISTFLPSLVVKQFIYPDIIDEIHNGHYSNLFIALSILTIMQFLLHTALSAIYNSLQNQTPIWETWAISNKWAGVTYSAGAVIAGLLTVLVDEMGFLALFATAPIVIFIYLTNRLYLQNVKISQVQAEQSKKYAIKLEKQASALRESEERFRTAFDFAPIGMALVSAQGKWLKVNQSLCKILHYTEQELLTLNFSHIIHEDDLEENLEIFNCFSSSKIPSFQKEQRFVTKNKDNVWVSWSGASIFDAEENHSNFIFQLQDISAKKIIEEKLHFEATHDQLTMLPNRAYFMSRLEAALAKFKVNREKNKFCVLFIDLDRFKIVNDNLGHYAGDKLLVEIAKRLKKCVRPKDVLARLAGDEFTILIEGNKDFKEAVKIADRIEKSFSKPFVINDSEIFSSASIGILQASEHHHQPEEILCDADAAMYQAKISGRSRYEIFDNRIHSEIKDSFKFENELRNAINRKELSVYYQPIYSIENEKIEGFEALARWQHKTLGFIPPDKFIKIAEDSGLINFVGEQILYKACTDGIKLLDLIEDTKNFSISVNLSCQQFAQTKLVETIERILIETGFPPQNLKLEITESVFFKHPENATKMLNQLCQLGIQISMDDFGTGYSNLNYLAQMPISTLKIDRSFISLINESRQNLTIVQTILTMAEGLGIKVIAEGVETESQLLQLKSMKCMGAQGYFFAKPMPFNETKDFCRTNSDRTIGFPIDNAQIAQIATLQ